VVGYDDITDHHLERRDVGYDIFVRYAGTLPGNRQTAVGP
jgi:hypothetical protein